MKRQDLQRRDWYLATLGVVRYVARGSVVEHHAEETTAATRPTSGVSSSDEGRAALRQLLADEAPAAPAITRDAAGPVAGQPESPGSSTGMAPESVAESSIAPSIVAARELSSREVESGAQPGKAQSADEQSADEQPADEIKVRLAVWQPAPDLLFFDSLQPGEQPSIQMTRLVANMVAALGRQADSTAVPQLIDWPPARSRAGGDLEAARTMVSAFCDARLSSGSVGLVLIMGKDAVRLLLPAESVLEEAPVRTCRWRELQTVMAPSLSDLLGDPSAKRRVWQALAPCVRR